MNPYGSLLEASGSRTCLREIRRVENSKAVTTSREPGRVKAMLDSFPFSQDCPLVLPSDGIIDSKREGCVDIPHFAVSEPAKGEIHGHRARHDTGLDKILAYPVGGFKLVHGSVLDQDTNCYGTALIKVGDENWNSRLSGLHNQRQ